MLDAVDQLCGVPTGYDLCNANGINASGQIVGAVYNMSVSGGLRVNYEGYAVLYEKGRWVDLQTRANISGSGLTKLLDASRINARGQIIGKAMGSGAYHAYLVTPVSTDIGREQR